MNTDFWCTKSWIIQDLPHQIWEAQTTDGHISPLIVRFFHNKITFWINNLTRCYFTYWSVDTITTSFTLIGLVLLAIGVFGLIIKKRWTILGIVAIGPLFPLLEIFPIEIRSLIYYLTQIILMVFGAYYSLIWLKYRFFKKVK